MNPLPFILLILTTGISGLFAILVILKMLNIETGGVVQAFQTADS